MTLPADRASVSDAAVGFTRLTYHATTDVECFSLRPPQSAERTDGHGVATRLDECFARRVAGGLWSAIDGPAKPGRTPWWPAGRSGRLTRARWQMVR